MKPNILRMQDHRLDLIVNILSICQKNDEETIHIKERRFCFFKDNRIRYT